MAASSGQDRTLARAPALRFAVPLKLLLLRFAPLLLTIALEPCAAAATGVHFLRRKLARKHPMPIELNHIRRGVIAAATWLLGVCVLILVTLKATDQNARTWADEIAWVAAGLMSLSIVLSRCGKSGRGKGLWQAGLADWSFLIGSAALLVSAIFSLSLL